MTRIRQWLTGTDDGVYLIDKETTVTPAPIPSAVPCLAFDGDTQELDTGLTLANATSAIDITIGVIFDSVADGDGIVGQGTTGGSFGMIIGTDNYLAAHLRPPDGNAFAYTTFVPSIGIEYEFRMTWDGVSELKLYNGDSVIGSESIALSGAFDLATIFIGKGIAGAGTRFHGKVSYYKLNSTQELALEETSGLPLDSSGNGNHPTANTATRTTADGISCKGLELGFTDAGTYTSYDILLISEDLKSVANPRLLDGGGAGYHAIAKEPQVSITAPLAHRTSLSGKGYTFTNEGAIL